MDRGGQLLQAFRVDLERRLHVVGRAVGATAVRVVPAADGEFLVEVVWDGPEKKALHTKTFTRALVFGSSLGPNPLTWRVMRAPCLHVKDLIREVLERRGVM